jgi:hypothetical protein
LIPFNSCENRQRLRYPRIVQRISILCSQTVLFARSIEKTDESSDREDHRHLRRFAIASNDISIKHSQTIFLKPGILVITFICIMWMEFSLTQAGVRNSFEAIYVVRFGQEYSPIAHFSNLKRPYKSSASSITQNYGDY